MKLSNAFMLAIVVLIVGGGVYWYQHEGCKLLEQISQSENKPFFFK